MVDMIHRKLADFVRMGRSVGVALALETDLKNSHRLLEFVQPHDSEYCGICFDTGHAEIDAGAVELAELLGPRVICTHLHDNDSKTDQHLPPFTGSIDWDGVIGALCRAGYTGGLTFECMSGTMEDVAQARPRLAELVAAHQKRTPA